MAAKTASSEIIIHVREMTMATIQGDALVGIILAIAAVLALPTFFVIRNRLRASRRRRLRAAPFPEAWPEIIARTMPLYRKLSPELRTQLHGHINVFLAEKNFEGCGGLELTDEIRLTIAAQACLLLLNRKTNYYRKLSSIVVYPHTYIGGEGRTADGITLSGGAATQGESWGGGTVVLTWDNVLGGAYNLQVLGAEYTALREKARKRGRSAFNAYGATNPAEFFAVATETFIEKPKTFKRKHPELYAELVSYYKFDPMDWR